MQFVTGGVFGFQANPAVATNPGQANMEWTKAGSLLQWAMIETIPWLLSKAWCPEITLEIMLVGDPETLLQAEVPVQMPGDTPRSWNSFIAVEKLELFWNWSLNYKFVYFIEFRLCEKFQYSILQTRINFKKSRFYWHI